MNTPNKLTLLRVILVPFFVFALLAINTPYNFLTALIIFIAASITDMLDGKIARKRDLVTDFGKFLDPLADKILVMSALICFVQLGITNSVIVIIILFRELAVTSIRLVASNNQTVVAANFWGKAKTVSQIVAILSVLTFHFFLGLVSLNVFPFCIDLNLLTYIVKITDNILLWSSAALTLISGFIYLKQNFHFLSDR
ncbi:MAG: CDP-diacylglycerol--glycerol-3-phosphate 3-phosphatidyltransferase [Bacillota bacterium]|nr:CDP-diacylglycerol--glycerol-3-phosphate 3-phosphatidyltransferase [Bacillota bacterium]